MASGEMRKCEHDIIIGYFCRACAAKPQPKPAYVYNRDQVIALNKIRTEQGHKRMLTGRETYQVIDGKRTGIVLDEHGKAI